MSIVNGDEWVLLWTPLARRKALSESYATHINFVLKNAKNDLKPTYFLKHNFYSETKGIQNNLANFRLPNG